MSPDPRPLPLLPDIDVWRGAFSRSQPVPRLVSAFAAAVEARRVFLVGWVRQGLLARAQDELVAERLARALAPFPDLPIRTDDHVRAAYLTHRLSREGVAAQPAQCLLWIMARRIGGAVWSEERHWLRLHTHGCPVVTAP